MELTPGNPSRRAVLGASAAIAFLTAAGIDISASRAAAAEYVQYQLPFPLSTIPRDGEFDNNAPWRGGPHRGVDFSRPAGTPIPAIALGTVDAKGTGYVYGYDYGNWVRLRHADGKDSFYVHMQTPSPLSTGSVVAMGAIVGNVGNTGNSAGYHLHLGLLTHGTNSFEDPIAWILAHSIPIPPNTNGGPDLLMIMKGTAPNYTFALFGPQFWYEWTGDGGGVANSLLLQIGGNTPGTSVRVSDTEWNAIKAEAQRVRTVTIAP